MSAGQGRRGVVSHEVPLGFFLCGKGTRCVLKRDFHLLTEHLRFFSLINMTMT